MDIYSEQLVSKKSNILLKKLGIWASSFLIAFLLFFLILHFVPVLSIIGAMGACCIMYGGFFLSGNVGVEYEYIITGSELDIDKIIGQRSRKRLLNTDIKRFTAFGRYTENAKIPQCDTTVDAVYDDSEQIYFAVTDHDSYGRTLLLFNPNDETLENIEKSLPRELRKYE